MFESTREHWRVLRRGPRGQRFLRYHEARQEGPRGVLKKPLAYAAGSLLVLTGTVMLVLPGPGLLVMIAGLAFIAAESRTVATALDRLEVRLHRLLSPLIARYRARQRRHVANLRRSVPR